MSQNLASVPAIFRDRPNLGKKAMSFFGLRESQRWKVSTVVMAVTLLTIVMFVLWLNVAGK